MRMRCVGWQNMSKQKCIQSFVLLTSKQFCWQENAALFLRVKFLHLLGQTRFNAKSSPSPFISSTVKSQILISACFFSEIPEKMERKATVCPHIPHCFVQIWAWAAGQTCEDKDLVGAKQTKENKERFPNWADRRSRQEQGTGKFLK